MTDEIRECTENSKNCDDSEIVRYQGAIAVRGDEQGNVLIRQEGRLGEDQFVDVDRTNVVKLCRAMLREAGFHQLSIRVVDTVEIRDPDGNPITIKASQSAALAAEFEKLDVFAEEERRERIAERVPWERRTRDKPRDRTATERQRRHRAAKRNSEADVTRDIVTERDGHGVSASGEAFQ